MAKNVEHQSWDELCAVILIRCKVNSEKKGIDWGRNNQRSISVVEVAFELGKSPCRCTFNMADMWQPHGRTGETRPSQ